jgi:hypothetical protein
VSLSYCSFRQNPSQRDNVYFFIELMMRCDDLSSRIPDKRTNGLAFSCTKCKNKVLDVLIIGKTSRVGEHVVTFSRVAFQDDTFEPRLYYFLRMVMDFAKNTVRYRRPSRHVRSLESIMHRCTVREQGSPRFLRHACREDSPFLSRDRNGTCCSAALMYGELRGRARLATAFAQLSFASFTRRNNEHAKHAGIVTCDNVFHDGRLDNEVRGTRYENSS